MQEATPKSPSAVERPARTPPAAVPGEASGGVLSERLQRFAEYAPIHFGITDPHNQGTFLAWNRVSEQMFGYTPEDAIGRLTARELHASEDEFLAVLDAVDAGGFDGECHFRRKDGSVFVGRLQVIPVRGADGQITERCGFIEDLTAAKQMLQALEDERRNRFHQDRIHQLGQLSGVIAHDINNVLFGVLCSSQLIAEDLGPDHPCAGDLQTIEQAVTSAATLMRKLLAFTGRQISAPGPLAVAGWVEDQAGFFRRLLKPTTTLVIENHSQQHVRFDANDLQQVVVNLLVNGDKAMPEGGTLTLGTRDHGDAVELWVEDTGVGIPAALQDQIFEPFFTTRPDGTGLGLSTARELVRHMGGELHLRSAEGAGTQVRLSLPRMDPTGPDAGEDATQPTRGPTPRMRGQVLLVDDQASVRAPLVRALRRLGLQVRDAASVSSALHEVERLERLHLLIVDSRLTDGSGDQVREAVRVRFPEARTVLISGYLSEEGDPRQANFDARLAKPFSLTTLQATLRDLLGQPPHAAGRR